LIGLIEDAESAVAAGPGMALAFDGVEFDGSSRLARGIEVGAESAGCGVLGRGGAAVLFGPEIYGVGNGAIDARAADAF